jgi:periplasmic protein TonB
VVIPAVFARTPAKLDPSYGVSVCAHLCLFAFLYAYSPEFKTAPQLIVVIEGSQEGGGGGGLEKEDVRNEDVLPGAVGPSQVRMRRAATSAPVDYNPINAAPSPTLEPSIPQLELADRRVLPEPLPELKTPETRSNTQVARSLQTASIESLEVANGFRSGSGVASVQTELASAGDGGSAKSERGVGEGSGSGGGRGTGTGGGNGAWFGKFPGIGEGNSPPIYPREALDAGREGVVRLRVSVAADGTVESLRVEVSSGDSSLDSSALTAVRQWRFKPAERGGVAVAAEVVVPVRFSIRADALSKQMSIMAS